ncbi:hypothetical protein D3C79_1059830 [compost metagenome]
MPGRSESFDIVVQAQVNEVRMKCDDPFRVDSLERLVLGTLVDLVRAIEVEI